MSRDRETTKNSSLSDARSSSAMLTVEEHADSESREGDGHEWDASASEDESRVSTLAHGVLQDSAAAPQVYPVAVPASRREHHLQLAGRLYEKEMEEIINGQRENLSELAAKYFSYLIEAAPSPGSSSNIYANAAYFAKANSMAAAAVEAKAEAAARRLSSESGDVAEKAIQKAAWEAGAAASVASVPVPEQQRRGCADDADVFKEILPGGSGGHRATGNSTAGGGSVVTISRETSGMSSFSSTNSRGYPIPQGLGMRAGSGSKWEVNAARPKQQMGSVGYVQMGSRAGVGGEGWSHPSSATRGKATGLGRAGQAGSYKRSSAAVEAPAASRFDLAGFVAWLDGGVLLTKINRQGRAKLRTLFYDEQNKMLWWNGPGAPGARFGSGSQRTRSSSLMSLRKEQPLPLASLIEVRMASQMDEPFCFDSDVDNSLQLVFPSRTVDLVAKDEEEATLLARGFQELKSSVA